MQQDDKLKPSIRLESDLTFDRLKNFEIKEIASNTYLLLTKRNTVSRVPVNIY